MVAATTLFARFFIKTVIIRHINLASEDRLQATCIGGFKEMNRAEEVAVFGQANSWHTQLDCPIYQRFDRLSSV